MFAKRESVVQALAQSGCIAPSEEADALLEASRSGIGTTEDLVGRRLRGEPLAWILGSMPFLGHRILIEHGVFVPRSHTEELARRAVALMPEHGVGVDLCTGCGAVALALTRACPHATVVATDLDPRAVSCARRNGVNAIKGNLDDCIPSSLVGRVDVMTAVVPYVPSEELHLLPRDVLANEPLLALDGGRRGTEVLARAVKAAARLVRPGGAVLLEFGGDQADELVEGLKGVGFAQISLYKDEEGQDRVIEAHRPGEADLVAS